MPAPQTPVLLIAWRRPAKTTRLLTQLQDLGLEKLYVYVDGPRNQNPSDERVVKETRRRVFLRSADFDLRYHFNEVNLGLKKSILNSIDWFFEAETFGIILEDDIQPSEELFEFTAECQRLFTHNSSVSQVSATTPASGLSSKGSSAYLSRFHHIWGFATWRRSWAGFRKFMETADPIEAKEINAALPGFSLSFYKHWARRVNDEVSGKVDTWDSSWNYYNFLRGTYAVTPTTDLAQNIGFDEVATNSTRVPLIAGLPPVLRGEAYPKQFSLASTSESIRLDQYVGATAWNTQHLLLRLLLALGEKIRRVSQPKRANVNSDGSAVHGTAYRTIAQIYYQRRFFAQDSGCQIRLRSRTALSRASRG